MELTKGQGTTINLNRIIVLTASIEEIAHEPDKVICLVGHIRTQARLAKEISSKLLELCKEAYIIINADLGDKRYLGGINDWVADRLEQAITRK